MFYWKIGKPKKAVALLLAAIVLVCGVHTASPFASHASAGTDGAIGSPVEHATDGAVDKDADVDSGGGAGAQATSGAVGAENGAEAGADGKNQEGSQSGTDGQKDGDVGEKPQDGAKNGATAGTEAGTPKKSRGVSTRATGDKYLIQFVDSAGQVIYSFVVDEGDPILPTGVDTEKTIVPQGHHFAYWYDATDANQTPEPFDGGLKAWRDMKFKPKFENTWHVLFSAEENPLKSVAVNNGAAVARPQHDPQRMGYTFSHWSTAKGGQPFDFNTPVTANLTLYAVWNSTGQVTYEVRYWVERANAFPGGMAWDASNNNNYNYLKYETRFASAGDTITCVGTPSGGCDLLGSPLDPLTVTDSNGIIAQYAEYNHWASNSTDGRIAANGTTVIDVYYTRTVFTLKFDLNSGTFLPGASNFALPATMSLNGQTYTQTLAGSHCGYTITAKYGEDISGRFPSLNKGMQITYNNPNYRWMYWTSYSSASGSSETLNADVLEFNAALAAKASLANNGGPNELVFKSVASVNIFNLYLNRWLETSKENYDLQTDPGRKMLREGRYYITKADDSGWLAMFAGANSGSATFFFPSSNAGYTLETTGAGVKYYLDSSLNCVMSGVNDGDTIDMFFMRQNTTYKLNLDVGGKDNVANAVVPSVATQTSIKFDEPIKAAYAPPLQTKVYNGITYSFGGWYTDKYFVDAFVPGMIMPTHDVTLYAKWDSHNSTARFYDYSNDASPQKSVQVGMNDYLLPSDPPYAVGQFYAGKGVFEGWRREAAPNMFIDFDLALDPVSEDMKLVAKWRRGGFKIKYVPGGTGGGSWGTAWDDPDEYSMDKNTKSRAKPFNYNDANQPGPGPLFTIPSGAGVVFIGWQQELPNGTLTGSLIGERDIFEVRGDMVLRAIYMMQDLTRDLTFYENDPTNRSKPQDWDKVVWKVEKNTTTTLPGIGMFSVAGYELIGWDEDKDAASPTYPLQGSYAFNEQDVEMYAIWKKAPLSITIVERPTEPKIDETVVEPEPEPRTKTPAEKDEPKAKKDTDVPQTGDDSINHTAYWALLLLAAAAICILARRYNRDRTSLPSQTK